LRSFLNGGDTSLKTVTDNPQILSILEESRSLNSQPSHGAVESGAEAGLSAPMANSPQLADGHSQEQQNVIDYAWEVSNGDMRFIYLLTTENGQYTFTRQHPSQSNTVGIDYGFCGINGYYHPNIVNDARFFTDWQWQMRECYRLYTEGTTFWGIIRYDNNPWIKEWGMYYREAIHNKFK
jgi:hypothetical protein